MNRRNLLRFIFIAPLGLAKNLPDMRIKADDDCDRQLAEGRALWEKILKAMEPGLGADYCARYLQATDCAVLYDNHLDVYCDSQDSVHLFIRHTFGSLLDQTLHELAPGTILSIHMTEETSFGHWKESVFFHYERTPDAL